jgi:hypothetical protein
MLAGGIVFGGGSARAQQQPLPGLEFLEQEDFDSARRTAQGKAVKAAKPTPAPAKATAKPASAGPVAVAKPEDGVPPEPAPAQPERVLLAWMNVPPSKATVEPLDPGIILDQAARTKAAEPPAGLAQPGSGAFMGTQFRNLRWGFSRLEVEHAEKALGKPKAIEAGTSSTIAFNQVQVAGRQAYLLCTFVFNKLARGVYVFKEQPADDQDWFSETKQLVDAISEKYGRPQRQEVVWAEDLYRNDQRYWGLALKRGHVQFENTWELPETVIRLKLAGTKYGISLSLTYESRFYGQVLSEVERRKRQAGL